MRCLMTAAFLVLSSTAAASVVETDINLNVAGSPLFKNDPMGGTITALLVSGGESAQGTAGLGQLKARSTSLSAGAINDTALVEFVDTISFIGNGSIGVSENALGSLTVNGLATAYVIATIDVTGSGILGYHTRYQKTVSTLSLSFESDDGPLVIPVSTGQSLTLFATILTGVKGIADANYNSTDNVYITALTPGLQIISAGGHDYSAPSAAAAAPEPATWAMIWLGGLFVITRRILHIGRGE